MPSTSPPTTDPPAATMTMPNASRTPRDRADRIPPTEERPELDRPGFADPHQRRPGEALVRTNARQLSRTARPGAVPRQHKDRGGPGTRPGRPAVPSGRLASEPEPRGG